MSNRDWMRVCGEAMQAVDDLRALLHPGWKRPEYVPPEPETPARPADPLAPKMRIHDCGSADAEEILSALRVIPTSPHLVLSVGDGFPDLFRINWESRPALGAEHWPVFFELTEWGAAFLTALRAIDGTQNSFVHGPSLVGWGLAPTSLPGAGHPEHAGLERMAPASATAEAA